MNDQLDASLEAQGKALRLQMQDQRRRIAAQLSPPANGQDVYPRSMTLRLLHQHPDLLRMLIHRVAGTRLAALLVGLITLLQLLRARVALRSRTTPPA